MSNVFRSSKDIIDEIERKDKKKSAYDRFIDKLKDVGLYNEYLDRIRAGIPVTTISEWLIKVEGIKGDKSQIIKFIRQTVNEIGKVNIATNSNLVNDTAREIIEGIDELKELNKLYKIQVDRINIDYNTEKKLNKLFKGTGYEIYLATKILSEILRVKMELGVLNRAPIAVDLGGSNVNIINGVVIDDSTRRKVLSILNEIRKLGVDNIQNKEQIIEAINKKMLESETEDEGNE